MTESPERTAVPTPVAGRRRNIARYALLALLFWVGLYLYVSTLPTYGGRADSTLERRLQTYLRPELLVLDDFGLKPLHPPAPEDLYDVINKRNERGSIMLTSNCALEEWPDLFGAPLLASADLDRLTHRAHLVVIIGASFRAHGSHSLRKEVHTGPEYQT